MTLERISAFITYCIAVVLAWLGDLSIKDASTLGGLMIGVLMLAINWYYKHKCGVVINSGLSASSLDEPASLEWRGM